MECTFQLLLAVFCTETPDCRSPIVTNTFIRDEIALMNYPFDFSIFTNSLRVYGNGRFIEDDEGIRFESNVFNVGKMDHFLIEAIISRDKLEHS